THPETPTAAAHEELQGTLVSAECRYENLNQVSGFVMIMSPLSSPLLQVSQRINVQADHSDTARSLTRICGLDSGLQTPLVVAASPTPGLPSSRFRHMHFSRGSKRVDGSLADGLSFPSIPSQKWPCFSYKAETSPAYFPHSTAPSRFHSRPTFTNGPLHENIMIAFVPLVAVALLHTVAASPIAIGVDPTVTVYITADTCLPTGSGGSLPLLSVVAPISSAVSSVAAAVPTIVSSATGFVGGAASSVFSVASGVPSIVSSATRVIGGDLSSAVSSATAVVGGAASSVISVAGVAVTAVPSFVSGALAAASSSAVAVDASLVSTVTSTQTTSLAVVAAANTLANAVLLISKGLAANSIPAALITGFVQSTTTYATSIRALADLLASGVSQATSTYLTSSVSSITTNLNSLTTQIQQLKSAGTAFNGQFLSSLGALQTSLQVFGTSLAGNTNAPGFLSSLANFNNAVSALSK
ncbi:hypothetical protein DFH09DRAFT_1401759, partial [Mycena vulgaris]